MNSATEPSYEPSYSYWLGTFVIRGSVAPRVILDVLGFGLLSTAIILFVQQVEQRFKVDLSLPATPFEAGGAILGLLLVLRVNAGYSRWWEARVLWGGIVNQSRNLATIGLAYGPQDPHWRSRFVGWVAAFPHVIRRSLRGQRDFPELERLLSEKNRTWVENTEHMPLAVASEIAILLRQARESGMEGFAFFKAEEQRSQLIDHVGGCERILKTPLPRSGAIQVRQFIFLFLSTLPVGMMQDVEQGPPGVMPGRHSTSQLCLVPLYVILLAYPLLSLDRIGMELQNPFSTQRIDFLPLDSICTALERNVLALLPEVDSQYSSSPRPDEVRLPPDAKPPLTGDTIKTNIS